MTYEREPVLRAEARELLRMLNSSVQDLCGTLDFDQRVELTAWLGEGRRLLQGEKAPLAPPAPSNVTPIRKMASPKFKRRNLLPDDGPGGAA